MKWAIVFYALFSVNGEPVEHISWGLTFPHHEKCIEFYADKEDLIILISSSGESKNMINAAQLCNKRKLNLVTFTGFKASNKLKKYGYLNFWAKSTIYNHIENVHQYWLLLLTDLASKNK